MRHVSYPVLRNTARTPYDAPMWKPASPIVIGGRALTDQEAWWHEFKEELQHAARAQALHLKSSGPWRSRCPGPWRQRW